MPRLKEFYEKTVVLKLTREFNYKNSNQVPKIVKISLNMGLGEAIQNAKILDSAAVELGAVSGQKAVITKARRSIAAFKLREGMPIGVTVTLRREKMYYFLDKLINIVLPRVRDFRGVSPKAFDGRGNYTLGIKEHIIFPEIDYDKIDKIKGLNISIVTTARTDDEARFFLTELGMPFRKSGQQH
ncbi:MAG: 50S ribosomal protein L5 [Candidatus Adiutrix intracellularis]|jgi:large subunit ribosomal protein L5|nr:MAG: 50S ribosomal protein L5 [Candidatus Adiutrix intracellularis]MDR2826681.1 50S ribosomal protein L5 [Candidatus Adiutrix intracellularis]